MSKIKIPKLSDITINQWYITMINGSEEMCKIRRMYQTGDWKVVCYYSGKDLFAGTLKECREWLLMRVKL